MRKIIDFCIYTTFMVVLFNYLDNITHNRIVILVLSLLLFNSLLEIVLAIYDKEAIKFELLFHSLQQSLITVSLFVILNEILLPIQEMNKGIRLTIIAFLIGVSTKHFSKYYNFYRY